MWCLETIIALNEAAQKRAEKGESISLAYKDCGINSEKPNFDSKSEEDKRIRVAS